MALDPDRSFDEEFLTFVLHISDLQYLSDLYFHNCVKWLKVWSIRTQIKICSGLSGTTPIDVHEITRSCITLTFIFFF